MKKKWLCQMMVTILLIQGLFISFVWGDPNILLDPVKNRYTGSEQGTVAIQNVNFIDVPVSHWAKESIVRMGALQLIKGYNQRFQPSRSITQEEVLIFMIRGMGLEKQAIDEGVKYPDSWSQGYIQMALQTGLITPTQKDNLQGPASREQVAQWMVQGLQFLNPDMFLGGDTLQKVYQYVDWMKISSDKIRAVEILAQKGIMKGKTNGYFDPKGVITRAEMAQILANMDELYYQRADLIRKIGKIGAIQDQMDTGVDSDSGMRIFRVRTKEGTIDELVYEKRRNAVGKEIEKDAVVYEEGQITGMVGLQEGDEIEYIIHGQTQTLLYISKRQEDSTQIVEGILQPFDPLQQARLSIRDTANQLFTYSLTPGLYQKDPQTGKTKIVIGEKIIPIEEAPVGSRIQLMLQNNVIVEIKSMGHPVVVSEIRGVLKEKGLNYITFIDEQNQEITKNFHRNEIQVTKLPYYEAEDQIGYIREIFPDFRYDAAKSSVESLELGDVITMQLDPYQPQYIKKIHASGHYVMRYGKVKDVLPQKGGTGQIRIGYEDGETEIIDISPTVFISQNKQKISYQDILPGDWVKVLVNQGVLEPGFVVETVKEIVVDGRGHEIANIYRGQLNGIFPNQNQLILQNAQRLTKRGWEDYEQIKTLDLSKAQQLQCYDNDRQVSLDYAQKFLTQHNGEVYIATEEYYGQERIAKITFRHGREQPLGDQSIIYANGAGLFKVLHHSSMLKADGGTIIRRHGRLVDPQNIMVPDYAQVVLNGENQVAVLDIKEEPTTGGIQILRGRIAKIAQGQSFQVQSFAALQGNSWSYYPIPRVFSIDYKTLFYDETGPVDRDTFIDYTDQSKIDKVYTIVVHGDQALYVVDNPYAREGVQGEIYGIENNILSIKDVQVYNRTQGSWNLLNQKNRTAQVLVGNNSILIKNGRVIHLDELEKGDKIRVMTQQVLRPSSNQENAAVTGYILFVEG